jgi:fumarylacetoacetate (FAA) hydrolase
MKLASLKSGGRDGALVVLDRNLKRAINVTRIAPTLQYAVEHWPAIRGTLQKLSDDVNVGSSESFEIDIPELASPLPRSFQFLDGSVYLSHMRKARKARGVDMPPNYMTEPLMYQGMSDQFISPVGEMQIPSEDLGIDFEGEIAVITDDVPMGTSAEEASKHIKLIMLLNDYTLRALTKLELPKQFGFLQAKPTSGFSPVAVTPDELGSAWDGEKVNLPLRSFVNDVCIGQPHAGHDMYFTYPQLIAHAARTRNLSAGTVIGAGTIANVDESVGCSCLAEVRANEEIEHGHATTPFLKYGDRVRIEMIAEDGVNIFGTIDHTIVPLAVTS